MNLQRSSFIAVAFVVLGASAACSAEPGPRSQETVTKGCLETTCDQRKRDSASSCSACSSACSAADYDCDQSTACEHSCGDDVACTEDDRNHCASFGFTALLPEVTDGNLEAACKRALAQLTTCGTPSITEPACALFAKTERPEMTATYDCYAKLPCGADASACEPAPTTFGDDLCAAKKRCGGTCTDAYQKALNVEGAWLRSDAQQAAKDCLAIQDCGDASDCFSAWYEATIF